jgi:hypothetical protein
LRSGLPPSSQLAIHHRPNSAQRMRVEMAAREGLPFAQRPDFACLAPAAIPWRDVDDTFTPDGPAVRVAPLSQLQPSRDRSTYLFCDRSARPFLLFLRTRNQFRIQLERCEFLRGVTRRIRYCHRYTFVKPVPAFVVQANALHLIMQAWARDAMLDPDWLRIGTDIVGGTTPPTFNMAFTLNGTVPEPATMTLMGLGLAAAVRRRFVARRTNRN